MALSPLDFSNIRVPMEEMSQVVILVIVFIVLWIYLVSILSWTGVIGILSISALIVRVHKLIIVEKLFTVFLVLI